MWHADKEMVSLNISKSLTLGQLREGASSELCTETFCLSFL